MILALVSLDFLNYHAKKPDGALFKIDIDLRLRLRRTATKA